VVGTHDSASRLPAKRKHSYFVRIINPKKKSDFVVRTWHDASETFDSPRSLKLKLMESFPDDVPDHVSFQVALSDGLWSHVTYKACILFWRRDRKLLRGVKGKVDLAQ